MSSKSDSSRLSMYLFIEKALQRTDTVALQAGETDRGIIYHGITLEEVQSEIRKLREEEEQAMSEVIIKNPRNIPGRFTMDTDLNLQDDDYVAAKGQECIITRIRKINADVIVMDGDRIIRATVRKHCVEMA